MDCAHCNTLRVWPATKMCTREAESRLPSFAGQDLAGHVQFSDAFDSSHLKSFNFWPNLSEGPPSYANGELLQGGATGCLGLGSTGAEFQLLISRLPIVKSLEHLGLLVVVTAVCKCRGQSERTSGPRWFCGILAADMMLQIVAIIASAMAWILLQFLTVTDYGLLRAVTMFKDTAPRRPRQYHVLPALASSFFAWFFSAETHVPLVFLLFIFHSAQEVHTAWVALRCILVFSFDIFFVLFQHAVVQAWASVFRRGGIVGHWAVFSESNCAMTCAMKSLSHYDNVHWLHRSSRSSSSHTWHVFISCCFLGWVLGMTWYMSILYLHWHKYIHTHTYIYIYII